MGFCQQKILQWVAFSFSRGSSQLKGQTVSLRSPALAGRFFTISAAWGAWKMSIYQLVLTFTRDSQKFHTNEAENELLWIENQIWTGLPPKCRELWVCLPFRESKGSKNSGQLGKARPTQASVLGLALQGPRGALSSRAQSALKLSCYFSISWQKHCRKNIKYNLAVWVSVRCVCLYSRESRVQHHGLDTRWVNFVFQPLRRKRYSKPPPCREWPSIGLPQDGYQGRLWSGSPPIPPPKAFNCLSWAGRQFF